VSNSTKGKGSGFDPIKFIDQLMSDGKWHSERQVRKALVVAYTAAARRDAEDAIKDLGLPDGGVSVEVALEPFQAQAEQDWKTWLKGKNTRVDQGLRLKEMGAFNGKTDQWGQWLRYPYWRMEQDPERIDPTDPFDRLPTPEEALKQSREEAQAYEAAEKAREAKRAGVLEE
jgi:hypothetical protein